jgi:hypothetical protein
MTSEFIHTLALNEKLQSQMSILILTPACLILTTYYLTLYTQSQSSCNYYFLIPYDFCKFDNEYNTAIHNVNTKTSYNY